jgi:hypothetical protein
VAAPASIRCIDDGNFSSHITFRTKTAGSASSADVERLRITSAGNLEIRTNAGNVASAFVYNENGGELVHYDETQTAATLLDQSSNQTRLLELINGSNLVLGLGGSNTTGSIVFTRAGYVEAMRIDSTGSTWIKSSRAWNDTVPTLNIGNDGDGRLQTRHIWGKSAGSALSDTLWLQLGNGANHVQIGNVGQGSNLYVGGDIAVGSYLSTGTAGITASNGYIYAKRYTNIDAVSTDTSFGLFFNGATDTGYAIYREAGAWTSPFPDLRICFHTGIKIGANATYNGIRFYTDFDMSTQVMSINNSADGLGAGNVFINNSLQINNQLLINRNIATPANYFSGLQMEIRATSGTAGIGLHRSGFGHVGIYTDSTNQLKFNMNAGTPVLEWNAGTILGTGNYNSYAPTLTGGGASGTWGISITGTARGLDSSHYIARTGSSGNANTDFSNTPAGTTRISGDDANLTNGAGGAWWFYQHMRHSNASSTWGVQVAWGWEDNANILRTRNVGAGTFGSWVTYLNSANYNSYAPTLTGGNASGTWNINAYPRRSDGTNISFLWAGQGGQPNWLWGSNDGVNMYVWNPSNFSVNYATSAGNSSTATRLSADAAKTTPGVSVKAYVSFAGDSATDPINNPANSYNIATVDRIGTGQYIIYIDQDAPHAQYAVASTGFRTVYIDGTLKYTWGFYCYGINSAGSPINGNIIDLIVAW